MSVRTEATALRPRARLTGRAAVLAVLVLAVGIFSIVPVREYLAQRDRVAQLERQAANLERANAELERRIARLNDPAYLELLARACLGMVRPGEIAFLAIRSDGKQQPSPC